MRQMYVRKRYLARNLPICLFQTKITATEMSDKSLCLSIVSAQYCLLFLLLDQISVDTISFHIRISPVCIFLVPVDSNIAVFHERDHKEYWKSFTSSTQMKFNLFRHVLMIIYRDLQGKDECSQGAIFSSILQGSPVKYRGYGSIGIMHEAYCMKMDAAVVHTFTVWQPWAVTDVNEKWFLFDIIAWFGLEIQSSRRVMAMT